MQTPSYTPAERPAYDVQPVTVDRPAVKYSDKARQWLDIDLRVMAMAQRLAGVKSRSKDHEALILASVACASKTRYWLDMIEQHGDGDL